MHDRYVRIRDYALTASLPIIEAMRETLRGVPVPEKPEIAYRASSMIRQARVEGLLRLPLRGDIEDAVAILLVLGISMVHD